MEAMISTLPFTLVFGQINPPLRVLEHRRIRGFRPVSELLSLSFYVESARSITSGGIYLPKSQATVAVQSSHNPFSGEDVSELNANNYRSLRTSWIQLRQQRPPYLQTSSRKHSLPKEMRSVGMCLFPGLLSISDCSLIVLCPLIERIESSSELWTILPLTGVNM